MKGRKMKKELLLFVSICGIVLGLNACGPTGGGK